MLGRVPSMLRRERFLRRVLLLSGALTLLPLALLVLAAGVGVALPGKGTTPLVLPYAIVSFVVAPFIAASTCLASSLLYVRWHTRTDYQMASWASVLGIMSFCVVGVLGSIMGLGLLTILNL